MNVVLFVNRYYVQLGGAKFGAHQSWCQTQRVNFAHCHQQQQLILDHYSRRIISTTTTILNTLCRTMVRSWIEQTREICSALNNIDSNF